METVQRVERYLQLVPKAELHVHLEGTIRPETFLTLAQRNQVTLPVTTVEEAREWFTYRDFPHFVEIFFAISSCLKTAEDYALIAYEFGAEMARQHVRYAEVTFSAGTHAYSLGVPHDTYFRGLQQGRKQAKADFGVEMRWVFDIVRDIRDQADRARRAEYTTAVALECLTSSRPIEWDGIPTLTSRVSCFAGGCLSGTTLSDWSYTASTGLTFCEPRSSFSSLVFIRNMAHRRCLGDSVPRTASLPGGQVTSSQAERKREVH